MSITKIILFIIIIAFLIIGMFLLPDMITSPSAEVSVLPSNQTLTTGETIEFDILIDPMGRYIAGAKFNLAFDRDMFKVNKITEGNLLKQNGSITYFNSGVLNDSDGTVTNIFGFVLGNKNVSNPGIFMMINFTVINSSGSSGINLSNVEISDPNGYLIAVNVTNGSVVVVQDIELAKKPTGTITGKVMNS
jgi:Cohesin domain